jgi:hypothetical protein
MGSRVIMKREGASVTRARGARNGREDVQRKREVAATKEIGERREAAKNVMGVRTPRVEFLSRWG